MSDTIKRTIDHIVYSVPDLDLACDELEVHLGIRPVFGGYHESKGTKNALLNLGAGCYLEILAIDHDNSNVTPPRWMGIDHLASSKTTRWALKSDNLPKDQQNLKKYDLAMGMIEAGTRLTSDHQLLTWEMILPLASPEVELMPFMVDWSQSKMHPCDNLEEGCELIELRFFHPTSQIFETTFESLNIQQKIQEGPESQIIAVIKSPKGVIIL